MKQIFLIAWREYRQYVFSRGFLLFLVMFPLGLLAIGFALEFLERNKPIRYFVVYDEIGSYTDDIDREIERRYMKTAISAWDAWLSFAADPEALATSVAEAEARLRPYLTQDRLAAVPGEGAQPLFAAILIPADFGPGEDAAPAQYWSRNLTDQALETTVAYALDAALRRAAIAEYGLAEDTLDDVSAIDAPLAAFRPDRAPEEAELNIKDRIETALPAGLTYMLLVIIFGAGNLLLTNTIEERSNKIVEILLSSVTANQLMMGKLAGIAAVGLTMPAIFLVGGIALSAASTNDADFVAVALQTLLSTNLLAIYLFYFLCAYLIFSMLFLAIGAVSNSLQDAQSYMGPVMLIVFAPLPLMIMVFQNPNGIAASVLTWIPIYTPYAVMMRAAADPPLWEIIGATALMLAFAIMMMRIMGRIFRQAILQASPPKMRDVWRLARSETH